MRKGIWLLFAVWLIILSPSALAVSYESYTYDYYGNISSMPAPYSPTESFTGNADIGSFAQPSDFFIAEDGRIYLCDTGNHRIVVLNQSFQTIEIIAGYSFQGEGRGFSNPQGIYGANGLLYVADTGNRRVVAVRRHAAGTWQAEFIIEAPASELLPDNFVFSPVKVIADKAGRVYVIGANVLEGLMYFDNNQQFMGYFGTIKVEVTIADWIWRQFATKEQRSKMMLFVPTEFTNFDIDDDGFIFTTEVGTIERQSVKRLNPSGLDVLKNYSQYDILGDLIYLSSGGISSFVDIKAHSHGGYTVLDGTRGRIFTYDAEGALLYVFAGMGTELGLFQRPVAIDSYGNSLFVLDQARGAIIRFNATEYGRRINEAIFARFNGEDELAEESWRAVLKLNAGYEPAYAGIGKSMLNAGDNRGAVEYLQRGMDKRYYSIALRRFRNEQLKEWAPYIGAAFVVLAGCVVLRRVKRRKGHE